MCSSARAGTRKRCGRTRGASTSVDAADATTAAAAARAALFAAYGSARYRQGRVREAVDVGAAFDGRGRARGRTSARSRTRSACSSCVSKISAIPNASSTAVGRLPFYEELDDQVGLADELDNLGSPRSARAGCDEALALFDRARAARQRAGDVVGEAAAMNNAAEALLDQGRAEEALALLRAGAAPAGVLRATRSGVAIGARQPRPRVGVPRRHRPCASRCSTRRSRRPTR